MNSFFMSLSFSFCVNKGKFFFDNGNRYEGEWKDGNYHGQGKKSDLLNSLLIIFFSLYNALIGEYFMNDGARYEGRFQFNELNGQG